MITASGLQNTSYSMVKMDTPSSFIGKMEIIQTRYDSVAAQESTYVLFWNKDTPTSISGPLSFASLKDKEGKEKRAWDRGWEHTCIPISWRFKHSVRHVTK